MGARRQDGRRRTAPWVAGLAVFALLAAGILGLSHFGVPWMGRYLEGRAAALGVTAEVEIRTAGLRGGVLDSVKAQGDGWALETGEVRASWDLPGLLDGRLRAVEIDRLETIIDLERWLPSALAAGRPPGSSAAVDATAPPPPAAETLVSPSVAHPKVPSEPTVAESAEPSPRPADMLDVSPAPVTALSPAVSSAEAAEQPARPRISPGASPVGVPPEEKVPSPAVAASPSLGSGPPGALAPAAAGSPPWSWWGDLPLEAFSIGAGSLVLRLAEQSLRFQGGVEFSAPAGGERSLNLRFGGGSMQGFALFEGEVATRAWSVQGNWDGNHPLNLARDLLPAAHPWHPDQLFGAHGLRWRAGSLNLDALFEGEAERWTSASIFAYHGPFLLEREGPESLLLRHASVAARRVEGRWTHAETVLGVDRVAVAGGETGAFQLDLAWSDEGGWRTELPALTFTNPRLHTSLAARGFLRPGGVAELQVAFSALEAAGVALEPFRWFVTRRAGTLASRLSDVRARQWTEWQLVQTAFTLEGAPWQKVPGGAWRLAFSTELEHRPEARGLARVGVELWPRADNPEADRAVYDWRSVVTGELGETLAEFAGGVGGDGGFAMEGNGSWALPDVLPYAFLFADALKGFQAGGRLDWSIEARSDPVLWLQTVLRGTLTDASLRDSRGGIKVEGIEGGVTLAAQGTFVRTEGIQELRIGRIALGEESVTNLVVRYRLLHRKALEVLSCEGDWLGGRIILEPFRFDPAQRVFSTVVRLENVEARRLFPDPATTGFLIDAKLSGSVPLQYSPERGPDLGHGLLQALNPAEAVLRVTDPEAFGRYLPLPETLGIRTKVLAGIREHFRFRRIQMEIFNPETPLTPLTVDFEGGVVTPEVDMRSIRVKVPQNFERPLRGWESLIILLSGGTIRL
jgi:hypothetical protein